MVHLEVALNVSSEEVLDYLHRFIWLSCLIVRFALLVLIRPCCAYSASPQLHTRIVCVKFTKFHQEILIETHTWTAIQFTSIAIQGVSILSSRPLTPLSFSCPHPWSLLHTTPYFRPFYSLRKFDNDGALPPLLVSSSFVPAFLEWWAY